MISTHIKSGVRIKLTEFLFNTHKLSTDFFIAKIMLEKVFEFPNVTIEEISYLSNTTPASVTKFCKKLGYHGFVELRTDEQKYDNGYIFNPFFKNSHALSIEDSLDSFLCSNNTLLKELFMGFDKVQVENIAKKLHQTKKVTVFSGLHGFAASNLFVELMIPFNIHVYEIERSSENLVIENAISFSELVFIISLTGRWANTILSLPLTKEEKDKIIVLNYRNTVPMTCREVVTLGHVDNFFTSNYISSNTLQAFFILLTAYLSKLSD